MLLPTQSRPVRRFTLGHEPASHRATSEGSIRPSYLDTDCYRQCLLVAPTEHGMCNAMCRR
jgi:hypothetical protein